jgi:hypothetical protein
VKRTLTMLALAGLAALAFVTTGCPENADGTPRVTDAQIRGGARGVKTAADEFGRELAAEVESGELAAASRDAVQPFVDEVVKLSRGVAEDTRDLDSLTSAERRQLIVDYAGALNNSLVKLNAAGALHLKSETAKRHFAVVTGAVRRGISAANILLAVLPQPTPTPAR